MYRSDFRVHRKSSVTRRSHAVVIGASTLVLIMFTLLLVRQFVRPLSDEPWPASLSPAPIQLMRLQ